LAQKRKVLRIIRTKSRQGTKSTDLAIPSIVKRKACRGGEIDG